MSRAAIFCLCSQAELALVLIRPGDDKSLASGLGCTLSQTDLSLFSTPAEWGADAEALVTSASGGSPVRAIFELSLCSTTSMGLVDVCEKRGADLYRWQPSVAMFKRLVGTSGPAWLAAGDAGGVSEDIVTEERGWGYLSGDEELVVDTAKLSHSEIALLLDLPEESGDGDLASGDASGGGGAPPPEISALGYRIRAAQQPADGGPPPPAAILASLTDMARSVLLSKATEVPWSYQLADGGAFPGEGGADGTFVSPLSGAPLFATAQRRRSTTGWPSFAAETPSASDGSGSGFSQHLASRVDLSGGIPRDECVEAGSEAHLGHSFEGQLCINAASLVFVRQGEATPEWLPQPAAPAIAQLLRADPRYLGKAHVATLAAGCFWSLRQSLAALSGVLIAVAGFTGGSTDDATYETVCSGTTGHVEAVQVAYDPAMLSYAELMQAYWRCVPDPTSRYRQGADVGAWYEPAVFYHSWEQREMALSSRAELQARISAGAPSPAEAQVVTRVRPSTQFHLAAEEHQR